MTVQDNGNIRFLSLTQQSSGIKGHRYLTIRRENFVFIDWQNWW
jgi:hypothetical protein